VPQGDGSPVIVIPGCFASDASLSELHSWLARLGYRSYFSGIGINARCPGLSVEMLAETVDRAFAETGRKVTLIGHSLGGLLARGAAIKRPDKVAPVITLGSPVVGLSAHPLVLALAELFHGGCDGGCLPALQVALPPSVEEINIYTRDDGVVDWQTCFREVAESIEVSGPVGLIFNLQVYQALARILSVSCQPVAVLRWEPQSVSARP
jgi:pimeloyl-ACP methyl ester carboxylesterase